MSYQWNPHLYPAPISSGRVIEAIATSYKLPVPAPAKQVPAPRLPKTKALRATKAPKAPTPARTVKATHTNKPTSGTGHTLSSSPKAVTNRTTLAADKAAGVHAGVYDWYTNLYPKSGRVGYNTGVIPDTPPPPVENVTPGTIDDRGTPDEVLGSSFPNGIPAHIPAATWGSSQQPTFHTNLIIPGKTNVTKSGKPKTPTPPTLSYLELVDPAIHYKMKYPSGYNPVTGFNKPPTKAKTPNPLTHRTPRKPTTPTAKTPPSLTSTAALTPRYAATPPKPVPSRVPAHASPVTAHIA